MEDRAKKIVAQVVEAFGDPKLCRPGHVRIEFGQSEGEWLWGIVVAAALTKHGRGQRVLRREFYAGDATLEEALQDLLRQIDRWKNPGEAERQESRAEALRLIRELHAKGEVPDEVLMRAVKELT